MDLTVRDGTVLEFTKRRGLMTGVTIVLATAFAVGTQVADVNLLLLIFLVVVLLAALVVSPKMFILFWVLATPMLDKFNLTAPASILTLDLYKNFDPEPMTFWALLNIALLPFVLLKWFTDKDLTIKRMPAWREFGVFLLWAAASALWASDPANAVRKLFNLVLFFLYGALAASSFRTEKDRLLLVYTIMVTALLYLPYYYLQFIFEEGGMIDLAGITRARGPLVHSNAGSYLLLPALFSIYVFKLFRSDTRGTGRALWWLAFLALFVAVLLCLSRGNVLILFFSLVLGSFLFTRPNSGRTRLVFKSLLIMGAATFVLFPIFEVRMGSQSVETLEGRTGIWETVWEYILGGNIIIGNGFGSTPELGRIEEQLGIPHSYYLQLWLEVGIVGVLLFRRFLWKIWRSNLAWLGDVRRFSPVQRKVILLSLLSGLLMAISSLTEVIVSSMNAAFATWMLVALPPCEPDEVART